MDTENNCTDKKPNCQYSFRPLTVIGFVFVMLLGVTGCYNSGTDETAADLIASKTGAEDASNTPSNHTDSILGYLHAPGKESPYSNWCTACHGADLTGDLGPSCTTCHDPLWTETSPPSSGGRTSNAPSNHTDNVNGFLHALGKDTPYSNWCTACHGTDLTGDLGPSCTACHDQVWTETTPPSSGGRTSNAPANHTDDLNGFLHAPGKETPYSSFCTSCHGADLTGDLGPSCTTCHAQVWTETSNPGSDGGTSNVPSNHIENVSGFLHASGKETPYSSWCTACHGADLTGDIGPSCTTCHGQVWTETAPPSSGGRTSNAPSNHTDNVNGFLHAPGKDTPYSNWCTACHGADLTGDIGPSCTTCHGQTWTETTPPSTGGRTSNAPSNHTDNVNGFLHAPGKDTPYTSFCSACHGADLTGDTGPSCTACHAQVWSETTPPSGGGGTGGDGSGSTDGQALYTANCAGCHGADAATIQDKSVNGITAAMTAIGSMTGINLTTAEIQAISDYLTGNTGGGTGGGSGSTGGQALYNANCAGCHGADAATIQDKSVSGITAAMTNIGSMTGISLTAAEIQAISDYLTGNTGGGGSSGGPPASHTNSEDGIMHAPGNDMPYTSGCTACHGPTLDGGAGPSCTNCHGVEWSESPPSGGDTGTGGSSEGQALYTTYCSGCHGTTGSSLTGRTVDQISTAISNFPSMNSIALSLTELQAIADYLAADTGSGTGGSTGGGSGTADGQALYEANCALCHGADAATIQDKSVSGITAAMTAIGSMTGINLTTAEIQAISDYLTGNTGGGTGGGTGGSGGLPASHTNSEEGVFHGEGNDTPYSSGCTACHGSTLQGGAGPSCFACHGVEWNESAPSGGGDSGGGSGTTDGQALYTANCAGCHGATGSGINNNSASGISAAINNIGSMNGISLSATEIQAISDFLTGNTSGSTGGSGSGSTDGQALYTANCAACHGATGSGINNNSASGISAAINNIGSMGNISLSATEIQAISDFLTGNTGGSTGGDTGSGGSSGPPASHTNSEDGVLHAPGNNYPYTNGCTACHGTTLQGGIGPSCFACHSVAWNESQPSGSDSGSTGSGGSTTDGQALYATYCGTCHGATGSNINGRTASAISSAITNVGAMNNISITSAEIQAIADYLAGSTGGSTGGGSSSGGLPSNHTNSEEGAMHAPGNNYPYSNGCTSCHGASLQGAIGPSCYNCHGQEWSESGSSSSGD